MTNSEIDYPFALANFMEAFNEACKKEAEKCATDSMHYTEQLDEGYFHPIQNAGGRKFIKLLSVNGSSRSVYCFIDKATGDIFKPASYNARAKGVRGNIFDPATYKNIDIYGSWLYIR